MGIAEARNDEYGNTAERSRGGSAATSGGTFPEQGDLLARLGIAIVEAGPVPEMLARLADAARDLTGARYSAIGVMGPDGDLIDFITSGMDESVARAIGDLPRGRGLLGAIRPGGGSIRLDDIGSDSRSVGYPPGHPDMTSFLGTPVRLGDRHFGNLYVTDAGSGAFTDRDEQLIEALAAYAAVAIRGGELRDERQRWIDGLQGVCDITAALSDPTRELSRVLPGAARRARALLGCDTVGIALGAPGELTVPYAFGPNALRLEAAEAFATEEEIAPRIAPLSCLLSYFGDGQTGGAIVIVSEGGPGPWRKDVADVLARHVGAAVHASRAADQVRDELIAESDERARELAIRLERESQELALAAQESERARIARELHDETGQLLTAISLRLKGFGPRLEDPLLAAEIDELRGHVRGVQTAIRTFLGQLRPVNLERGLGSAVAQLADDASRGSSCAFEATCDALPPMDEEIEVAIYRIAQEAITNVLRHSRASHASVILAAEGGRLRLSVEDDGRGFSTDVAHEGFGLTGIHERAGLVGGDVRVDSAPGTGTAVVVDIALTGTTTEPRDSA